jgi:hypothetical protein
LRYTRCPARPAWVPSSVTSQIISSQMPQDTSGTRRTADHLLAAE